MDIARFVLYYFAFASLVLFCGSKQTGKVAKSVVVAAITDPKKVDFLLLLSSTQKLRSCIFESGFKGNIHVFA